MDNDGLVSEVVGEAGGGGEIELQIADSISICEKVGK